MKKWIWINIILKALDIGTTYYCVNLRGLDVEKNPLMRALFGYIGLSIGLVSIFALFSLLIYYLYSIERYLALKIIAGLMAMVVINNFIHVILWG